MVIGVLGDLEVRHGDQLIDVGHSRRRSVLAALAAEVGQVVPTDRLLDRVWGERPPIRARSVLRTYLTHLRRALAPIGATISRHGTGYLLTTEPDNVDVHRFRRLLAEAREQQDPLPAEEALALWRGEPLAELDTPWARQVRERLRQERTAAEADLIDWKLDRGQHRELIPALLARTGAWPLDERAAGQLMFALYRAGRQADALQHYQRTRVRLVEELGVDPAPALQELHQRILTADPSLTRRSGGPARASARPNFLPRDLPDFTGREAELARLVESARGQATVHTVDGMAGVGKTTFAVHAGHLLADGFPDGALFVDLQGHTAGKVPLTPDEALDVLLRQLGVEVTGAAAAQWQARTATLRLLIVFDNAVDEAQVAPLLPSGPSLVIVTSRSRLPNLVGARPLSLAVLPQEVATAFFARLVGAARAEAEPEAVGHIVNLCAGLPLALRLSGAQLAHRTSWPIAHLSAQLANARRRLPKLFADREVALAFRTSHDQLLPVDRQVFYALGRHPGAQADTEVLAAMTDLPVEEADEALQRLVDVHLAEEPAPGRYRQHDLLRQFARGLSDDPKMTEKMLDHYLTASAAAAARLDDGGDVHAWLVTERGNLLAAMRSAAAEGYDDYAWQLAITFWHLLGSHPVGDPIDLIEQGLAAAEETAEEGLLSTLLALAHWSAGDISRAYDLLTASVRQQKNPESHAHTLALLGLMNVRLGAHAEAFANAQEAFDELAALPRLSPLGLDARIMTCWTRGVVHGLRGEHESALGLLRTAYAGTEELGNLSPNDHVLTALARCLIALDGAEEALGYLQRSLELRRRISDRSGEAEALLLIGTAHRAAGRAAEALEPQRAAVAMLDSDTRLLAHALIELGRTHAALGDGEAVQHYQRALGIAIGGHHLHEQAQAHRELGHAEADELASRLGLARPASLPHLRPAGW